MWTTLRVPHISTRQTNNNYLFKSMRKHNPTGTVRSRIIKNEYLVNSFQDDYTTVNLFQDYGASFSQNCKRISGRSKGASGNQVSPDSARPAGPKSGFWYPVSIFHHLEIAVKAIFSILPGIPAIIIY